MGKFGYKGLFLLGSMIIWGGAAQAQYLRSSYFMEGTSARLQLNPGLQPTKDILICQLLAHLICLLPLMCWGQVTLLI